MENIYFVYQYSDENNIPFYIGKGKEDRYKEHFYLRDKTYANNTFFYKKLNKLLNNNKEVNVKILHNNLTNKEASDIEIYYIAFYGRRILKTGTLCNLTPGGDGGCSSIITEETRNKLRKAGLGRKHTIESRQKMSKVQKGLKHKSLNEEQLILHGKVAKDRWENDEFKEKRIKQIRESVSKEIIETKSTGEKIMYKSQFDIIPDTKTARWKISQCCRGMRKSYLNSKWSYTI